MPIAFESIQDPWGLNAAGTMLGKMLFDKSQQKREQQFILQREAAARNAASSAKSSAGTILSQTLQGISQLETQQEKESFIAQAMEQGLDPQIGMNLFKEVRKEDQQKQLMDYLGITPPSPTESQAPSVAPGEATPQGIAQQAPIESAQQAPIQQLSFDKLVAMAASGNPAFKAVADMEMKRRDLDIKKYDSDRKYAANISTPYLLEANKRREGNVTKRFAVKQMRDAVESGNLGFFSLDNLASITGIEALRTASGAKLVGAAKELMLGNIARVGRPNQWIEQQIQQAIPNPKQNKATAAILTALQEGEIELATAGEQIIDEIVAEDKKLYGYVKEDIGARVSERMHSIEDFVQKKTAFKTRYIYEKETPLRDLRNSVNKKTAQGTPLTPWMYNLFLEKHKTPEKAIENAIKLGYELYSPDLIESFENG